MQLKSPVDLVSVASHRRKVIDHMNPLDDEDLPFEFNLSTTRSHQTVGAEDDFSGLQRTAEGARQSAGSRSDDVIKRGRMRFGNVRGNTVMSRNGPVNPKQNRIGFGWQVGLP